LFTGHIHHPDFWFDWYVEWKSAKKLDFSTAIDQESFQEYPNIDFLAKRKIVLYYSFFNFWWA